GSGGVEPGSGSDVLRRTRHSPLCHSQNSLCRSRSETAVRIWRCSVHIEASGNRNGGTSVADHAFLTFTSGDAGGPGALHFSHDLHLRRWRDAVGSDSLCQRKLGPSDRTSDYLLGCLAGRHGIVWPGLQSRATYYTTALAAEIP